MPDAIITSTESTFGTISGTFAADQSTITGTISGIITGTLDGSVGVPGPQGPQGEPGEGVPAGGLAGQFLQKIDGVDYNTDWVTLNLSAYAPLNSPLFTGDPRGPTAALGDNDTSLATTAFVQQELASGVAVAKNLEVLVRNQSGSTIAAGSIVYISGATGNKPLITLAQANNDANSAQTMGFVKTAIANNGTGYVIVRGEVENLDTSALTEGAQLYLSPTTAGTWTTTKPSAPEHLVYVGIVIRSHPTQGVILVAVQNGYELNELHDVAISSPTNGQVLKYDSATNLWKNQTDLNSGVWGSITGTLSSQTDLQTALDGKYSTTNPAGYITSSALAGYATESWVTSQGYITSAALSPYLTSATAASTYQTIAGMSSYLTTSAAAATYQTQAAMASYATESWVTSQGYLTDAPSDGNQYARKNGAWDIVSGGGSSYITSVTSPLLVTSGDLSIDLTGYATESWVTSQGYITSVGFYPLTQDLGFDTSSNDGRLLVDGVYDPTASGSTSSRINIGSTTPSAPLNGDFWSNGTKFRYTLGGTTYDIASEAHVNGLLTSYAPKASPALTGVPTAPTAAVGTNTTQIATTAFVLANAGSPTFASIEDTLGASISNEALSPAMIPYIIGWPGYRSMNGMNFASSTGTGAGNTNRGWMRNVYIITAANSRATVASSGYGTYESYMSVSSSTDPRVINFSKKVAMWGLLTNGHNHETINTFFGTTNSFLRCNLGGRAGAFANGNITQKGIGFYLPGGGASEVQLTVHNGTTRTDVASGFTPASNSTFHYFISSDGAGNVYLYINGTLRCQTNAGPTGLTTSNYNSYEEQCDCNASNTTRYAGMFAATGVYIEL